MFKALSVIFAVSFLFSCSAENPFQSFYSQMYLNEGNRFFIEGDHKKAIELYDRSLAQEPQGETRYYALFFRASSRYQLGKYSPAIEDLTAAVRVMPKAQEAYLLRGNGYLKMEQYDEARADFETAIRLNPGSADAHYSLGDFFYALRSFQKAMDEYALAVRYDPDRNDAYRRLGDILSSIDLNESAISNYDRAIELNPTNRAAFEGRANAYARKGKKLNATLDALTAKDLARQEAKIYWKKALAALGKSDIETALRMYGLSLGIDPSGSAGSGNPGDTWYDRGMVYLHEKKHEQALIDFKRTVALNPKNWKAYSSLGICYFELGYYQAAESQFRSALRENPRDELSVYYIGRIGLKMEDPDRAIEQFSAAIRMDPKLLQAYEERANAYLEKGSFREALDDYNALVEKGWTDPSVLLKRGKAYDELGFFDDAIADFTEYIRVSPKKNAPAGVLSRGNSFMGMKKYALAYRDYSRYLFTVMTNGPYETNSVKEVLTNMNKCYQYLVKRRKI